MASLLFLAHRIPFPPDKGDKIRAWHLLRHLARHHTVHLGCLIDDPDDRRHLEAVRAVTASCYAGTLQPALARLLSLRGLLDGRALTFPYFSDAGLARWVAERQAACRFDLEFVFSSAMAPYLGPRRAGGAPCRVIDFVDVDSDKWAQYAATRRGLARWLYRREATRLAAAEQAIAAAADLSLFVSEAEAALFRQRTGNPRAAGLSNGVDLDYFRPDAALPMEPLPGLPGPPGAETPPALVFTGAMDYWPNIDAVVWFANEILPRIRARVADAAFWIVGARPAPPVVRLSDRPGVVVTGRVPDVRPWLARAQVAVAPLRIARGIQNKVLEAMAMAMPVVATPQAFEGIEATPGRDLLVAADADGFADAVVRLLGDAGARARLGGQARHTMQSHYGWPQRLAGLDRLLEAAGAGRGTAPAGTLMRAS